MKINKMKLAKRYLLVLAAVSMAVTSIGCESLTADSAASKKKKKDSSWFSFKKKEYQTPKSMTATWTHDILTLPGKAPTRGFGGRFYFYNEKTQAIPVDGDLMVYGFDDTKKQLKTEDLSQANKRFRFTAEQLTTHFTEGELGASYSVWIPWDEAYGAPKKIMLIPTFLDKEGRTIRGAAASLNLPGVGKEEQNEMPVQQASALMPNFDSQNTSNPPSGMSGLRTTTIQVPSSSLMRQTRLPESQIPGTNVASGGLDPSLLNPNNVPPQPFLPPPQAQLPQFESSVTQQPGSSPQNKMSQMNANGWVSPVYSQPDWSRLSPRSVPNQFQAPASQASQPSAYPTR